MRVLTICRDYEPSSPLDWDRVGTIVIWNRHYYDFLDGLGIDRVTEGLGDDHIEIGSSEDYIKELPKGTIILPLYLYFPSGCHLISTRPFWDGQEQCGIIYPTPEVVKANFGNNFRKAEVKRCLRTEIEYYSYYLSGECWGFVIKNENGNLEDSCWGFLGDTLQATGIVNALDDDVVWQARQAWKGRY